MSEATPEIPDLPERETKAEKIKGGASPYIGETEKNLGAVLPTATRSNASLLITDSDSLFKR